MENLDEICFWKDGLNRELMKKASENIPYNISERYGMCFNCKGDEKQMKTCDRSYILRRLSQ